MDVRKEKKVGWRRIKNKHLAILAAVSTLVVVGLYVYFSDSDIMLSRADLAIGTVQKGEFVVQVKGYGDLRSNRLRALTALNKSTVKEIVLRPGAEVSSGSLIVVLENPELAQLARSAKQDLSQAQANLRRLRLNQQLELLQEETVLAELEGRTENASLRLAAEKQLLSDGVVSRLSFLETQAAGRRLQGQLEMQEKKLDSLARIHKESITIEEERVEQLRGELAAARKNLDSLQVRAEFNGILQRLSVTEGQSLRPGQEIAMIGSDSDMVAILRVPQNQADSISIGQAAIIDTRRDQIRGKIIRIDPVVENNNVRVEVELPKELPDSARPQQSISGHVVVESLSNTLYVERPVGIRAHQSGFLYRLDPNSGRANRTELEFGYSNDNYIEIRGGAAANDKFIISDLSHITQSIATVKVR